MAEILESADRSPDKFALRVYLNDIGQHPLLQEGEVEQLAYTLRAGREAQADIAALEDGSLDPAETDVHQLYEQADAGVAAQSRMIQGNLRLVVSIARKRPYESDSALLEHIQNGNIGLMHAVEKFDPDKGFAFSTYATWWIRRAIQKGMRRDDQGRLRLRAQDRDGLDVLQRAQNSLLAEGQTAPSLTDLADRANMSEDRAAYLLDTQQQTTAITSLDAELAEGSDTKTHEVTPDNTATLPYDAVIEAHFNDEFIEDIKSALDHLRANGQLTEIQETYFRAYYGLDTGQPLTLRAVAARHGVSHQGVKQRITTVETRLKAYYASRQAEQEWGLYA